MTVAVASRLQLTDGSHVEEEFKREEKKFVKGHAIPTKEGLRIQL